MALQDLLTMRRKEPELFAHLVAHRQVKRGVRWLNRHAPRGWLRNCFDPLPGTGSSFRGRNSYADQCILALAFEFRRDLACEVTGIVSFATVANAFRLSMKATYALGFDNEAGAHITSGILDAAWERELRKFENRLPAPYQHDLRAQHAA